jgi:hypothetical protein
MFETQGPVEKGSKLTLLVAIFSVLAVLGATTWYFTK